MIFHFRNLLCLKRKKYSAQMCILVTYCYLRYADDTTLVAESDEELKSLLLWVKEERGKVSFKLNIQKAKIMTSGPITSWQTDREIVEAMTDFIFLGSKITVDSDCNHEIKRQLPLGRKAMANIDSILKSKVITLPAKVHVVKAMVFPISHVHM